MRDLLERFAAMPRKMFAPGETLVADGQRSGSLYVLIEGTLEVQKGGVRISTINEPGVCIGEVGLLLDIPATATVMAVTPTVVHVAEDGAAVLRTEPEVTVAVARLLAERLNLVTTFLADIKRQYAGESGSLAVVDKVLAGLTQRTGPTAKPGSAREPDPLY